jgi:zinc and cadmium transporter
VTSSPWTTLWTTLASVLVVSLVPLAGLLAVWVAQPRLERVTQYLVSFAVGALLGGALLHLIPEAAERMGPGAGMPLAVIGGFVGFFALEKFLWAHHGHGAGKAQLRPFAALNLLGDGLHNLMDGMVIAAAYLTDPALGLATTLAVILHEVPQEIGDFGILVHSGLPARRAVWLNLLTGLTAMVGALVTLTLGRYLGGFATALLPVAAGGFIYIAASDLVPELHRVRTATASLRQIVLIALGVAVMLLPELLG